MKKNFRKVPKKITSKLGSINSDYVEIGVVLRITATELREGKFAHLHMGVMANNTPVFEEEVLPFADNGRTSKVNYEGKEIIRKDLPKVSKTFSVEVPSWGDWSNGSHTIDWDREVYQRDYIDPRNLKILVELLNTEKGDETAFLFKFRINSQHFIHDLDFDADLLYSINLLQENIGAADIFQANADDQEYLKTEYLEWEIFPPGQKDVLYQSFMTKNKSKNKTVTDRMDDRYNFLSSMEPTAYIRGTNGFKNYFGAKFGEDLVVFENIDYGNAIYILNEDWESLSKLSRTQLLKEYKDKFIRIVHNKDWKANLEKSLQELRS